MLSTGTNEPKKRGRPSKYACAEEKKTANTERRRAQRKNKAAGVQELQSEQPYVGGPGQTAFFLPTSTPLVSGGPSTLERVLGQAQTRLEGFMPNESNDFGEYLPPLSPLGSPSLGPISIEPDGVLDLHVVNSETATGAGRPTEAECEDITTISDGPVAIHADGSIVTDNLTIENEAEEVGKLANQLTDQLIRHQGCCQHCHQQSREEYAEHHPTRLGLQQYLDRIGEAVNCPDVLASNTISTHGSNLASQMDTASKRHLYCGLDKDGTAPVHICLEADNQATVAAEVIFDIDSVLGFPSSLAVAKQGIRWNTTQIAVTDLRPDLHLDSRLAHYVDRHGHSHSVRKPLHQLPHYTFGRLVGFEDVSMYIFFPHLYREEQKLSRLLDDDFRTWMDQVLLPVVYQHHDNSLVQHYPSSFDHARYNSTARGVEGRSQRTDVTPRQQLLFHFLPPDFLHEMWENILQTIERPGLQQFRGAFLFLQGKNLKCLTKDSTWEKMTSRFDEYWRGAVAESYMTSDAYFDVGKEVCPVQKSRITDEGEAEYGEDETLARTLLWKRCCLETYGEWMRGWHSQEEDGHRKTFYPFSMLHESGSLTIETHQSSKSRAGGLLYTQFYSSIKEVFAAGNVYPFTNVAIETLALDPKLRKTWQHVGAGLSHNPVALIRAYLYTKLRCHYAILGSMQKSFGTREGHRVSTKLFSEIDVRIHHTNDR